MTRFHAFVVVGLVWTAASAQSAPPRTPDVQARTLRGRVLSARNSDPLSRARVVVAAEGASEDVVLTDDGGRFSITLARPSHLTLTVRKAGYAAKRVQLPRQDVMSGAVHYVRLEAGAAISGRVVHPSGRPAVARAIVARRAEGLDRMQASAHPMVETDDRGEYRVGALPAGRYTVTVSGAATKATVTVKAGDEAGGVNLVVDETPHSSDKADDAPDIPAGHGAGSAVLEGRIVGDLGDPLAGARIRLQRHGMNVRSGFADANGRYALDGISEGRYTLQASHAGYVALEYGQRRSSETGRVLRLRHDDTLRGLEFVLPRGSVVTGNVVDEHGEPVEGVLIRALQLRFVGDREVASTVPGVRERRSDDRGQYRLYGLLPGTYLVTASIDAAVSSSERGGRGYAPSYYPGTANIGEAWPVSVDMDRDVYGAHIVLAPSAAVRISGTVRDSRGNGLKGLMVLATSRWSRHIVTEPRTTPVNGTFVLSNVPPGDYVLQATSVSDAADPTEFVAQYIRVADADVSVSLTTQPGARMSGRVTVEGGPPAEDPSAFLVPVPADLDRSPLAGTRYIRGVESGGRLTLLGLHGPIRLLLSGAPPGWYLKSVTINGQDATDVPYDFTFGNGSRAHASIVISLSGGTIRGRVIDERSATVSEYTVVVFAADRAKRFPLSPYTKFARPSQDDSFEVSGLPPGDYRVAAVPSLDATVGAGDWQNPAVLDRLSPGAHRVTVGEGDVRDVTIPIATPSTARP